MIVVDTSALMAILKNEPFGDSCRSALFPGPGRVLISAATLTEAYIVAARNKKADEMQSLVAASITEIVPLTQARAQHASAAYTRFGKGFHPAALNFGDCFSYATAQEFDCPLLYVGNDFAQTDIRSALADA